MKKLNQITILPIFIALLIILTGCSSNDISNQTLSKDNYEEITQKYSEENKESDNLLYFTYAISNYILKDGMANVFNFEMTEEQKNEETYKNIYGKTINQLVKEGKELMKENNMTVDKYKETLKNLSNSINEFNQSTIDF